MMLLTFFFRKKKKSQGHKRSSKVTNLDSYSNFDLFFKRRQTKPENEVLELIFSKNLVSRS